MAKWRTPSPNIARRWDQPGLRKACFNLGAALLLIGDFDDAMPASKKTPAEPTPCPDGAAWATAFCKRGIWTLPLRAIGRRENQPPLRGGLQQSRLGFRQKGQIQNARDSWRKRWKSSLTSMLSSTWPGCWRHIPTARCATAQKRSALAAQANQLSGRRSVDLRTLARLRRDGQLRAGRRTARPALESGAGAKERHAGRRLAEGNPTLPGGQTAREAPQEEAPQRGETLRHERKMRGPFDIG